MSDPPPHSSVVIYSMTISGYIMTFVGSFSMAVEDREGWHENYLILAFLFRELTVIDENLLEEWIFHPPPIVRATGFFDITIDFRFHNRESSSASGYNGLTEDYRLVLQDISDGFPAFTDSDGADTVLSYPSTSAT